MTAAGLVVAALATGEIAMLKPTSRAMAKKEVLWKWKDMDFKRQMDFHIKPHLSLGGKAIILVAPAC